MLMFRPSFSVTLGLWFGICRFLCLCLCLCLYLCLSLCLWPWRKRMIYNFSETPWFCFLFVFEWILSILLRDPWRQVGGSRRSEMAGSGNIPTTRTRSPGYRGPYFAILMITAGYRTWTRSLPHWLTSSYWVDLLLELVMMLLMLK